MRERNQGAIVNLSSVQGWVTVAYSAACAASKHAVESLSEGLWYELAPLGVRVAVVEPGAFATSFRNNIVTAPDFNEASPHWTNGQRYGAGMQAIFAATHTTADPQEVADRVFEAATTATPKFRCAAGADARAVIPACKSMEFEAFKDALLARAGRADWAAVRA